VRFCSTCAGAIRQAVPTGDDRERHICGSCGTIHYVNPKVVVGSVCTFEGRVLICRRAIAPRAGFWTIPAGYLETSETAEEGAIREAWEEARARIRIDGLLAVYSVARIDQVQLLYRATLLDPGVEPGPESLEVRLVPWSGIPWPELAFTTVHWVLRRAIELDGVAGPIVTVSNPEAHVALAD